MIDRIRLAHGDLTQQSGVDAIVTALPIDMDTGGRTNQSIIAAIGPHFDEFLLENIFKPHPGDVYAVPGFTLPAPRILVVMTPVWKDNFEREDRDLLRCYRHITQAATRMGLKRIAFPAIGAGSRYGFPVERAVRLGIQGILDRFDPAIEEVRIVCKDPEILKLYEARLRKQGWKGYQGA